MGSPNHTQIITDLVAIDVIPIETGTCTLRCGPAESETARDVQRHECRGITAVNVDAHIAIRKKRISDAPGIDQIG